MRWWQASRAAALAAVAGLAALAGAERTYVERLGATLARASLALGVLALVAGRTVPSEPRAFTGPAAVALAHLTSTADDRR